MLLIITARKCGVVIRSDASVCLSVCLSVCGALTFESLDRGFIIAMNVGIQWVICEGYRVKVIVTGAKKHDYVSCSLVVCLPLKCSLVDGRCVCRGLE